MLKDSGGPVRVAHKNISFSALQGLLRSERAAQRAALWRLLAKICRVRKSDTTALYRDATTDTRGETACLSFLTGSDLLIFKQVFSQLFHYFLLKELNAIMVLMRGHGRDNGGTRNWVTPRKVVTHSPGSS